MKVHSHRHRLDIFTRSCFRKDRVTDYGTKHISFIFKWLCYLWLGLTISTYDVSFCSLSCDVADDAPKEAPEHVQHGSVLERGSCSAGSVQCANGVECIQENYQCDMYIDCSDKSDEAPACGKLVSKSDDAAPACGKLPSKAMTQHRLVTYNKSVSKSDDAAPPCHL